MTYPYEWRPTPLLSSEPTCMVDLMLAPVREAASLNKMSPDLFVRRLESRNIEMQNYIKTLELTLDEILILSLGGKKEMNLSKWISLHDAQKKDQVLLHFRAIARLIEEDIVIPIRFRHPPRTSCSMCA